MNTRKHLLWLAVGIFLLMFHRPTQTYAMSLSGVERVTFTDSLSNIPGQIVELKGNGGAPDQATPTGVVLQSLLPGRGTVLWVQPKYDATGNLMNDDAETGYMVIIEGDPHVVGPGHTYFETGFNWRADKQGHWVLGEVVENGGTKYDIWLKFGGTKVLFGKDGIFKIQNKLQSLSDSGVPMVELGQQGLLVRSDGTLKLVQVGQPNSGGYGKSCLVVDN